MQRAALVRAIRTPFRRPPGRALAPGHIALDNAARIGDIQAMLEAAYRGETLEEFCRDHHVNQGPRNRQGLNKTAGGFLIARQ
jgi:hypothetical protein